MSSAMNKDAWDRKLELEAALEQAVPGGGLLISLKDAAAFLGVSVKTIRADKRFPLKKLGGRYYVTRKELIKWAAA